MYIKLHNLENTPIYFRVEYINVFYKNPKDICTTIYCKDNVFFIKETPEEIINILDSDIISNSLILEANSVE